MAHISLGPGERLIGQGLVSWRDSLDETSCQCWHCTVFVTSRRVCLHSRRKIELPLPELSCFTAGRVCLLFPSVTLWTRPGEGYTFTGFPIKKLQNWLLLAGLPQQP